MFEFYDVTLLSFNLKHIQADLGIAESQVAWLGGLIRAGALGSIFVTFQADRVGRRRLLLYTIVGYTLLTGATAFAPGATSFVVFQLLARVFAAAEVAVAIVVVAEEFDAEHRGWGIGALGALQACGAGLAALAFAFVDVVPFGWRAFYAVGLVPLTLVAFLRRTLPETQRFDALALSRTQPAPALAPARALLRAHPRRIAVLAVAVLAIEAVIGPATFLAPKFLQDVHGWKPGYVAALNGIGGAFAIVGNAFAGWLSDRRGRRPVTVAFATGVGLMTVLFYSLPGAFAPAVWILLIFTSLGTNVTLAAYGAEMFPTDVRSTASGVREFCRTGGAVLGLGLVSALYGLAGSNWQAIVSLCALGALSPLCVLFAFPETAGQKLEEISKEADESRPTRSEAKPSEGR